MKKVILSISFSLFFILLGTYKASAVEGGVCILKQKNNIYEIETPFYWYATSKEVLYDHMLNETVNYYHSYITVKTRENCENLNNLSPSYEQGFDMNALNKRYSNFYYSKRLIENSEIIFEYSKEQFMIPELFDFTAFEITSTYITFDNLPPIIANDQIDSLIIANVNFKFSVESLKSKITAYDEVDGIVNVEIIEDNYSNNYNTLGTYSIIFSAIDNSGNLSSLTINIKVVDKIKPTIKGPNNINSYMSNPLTVSQIKDSLSVNDNYDTNLNNTIKILSDNYSSNIHNEGVFEIAFIAHDNSNNDSLPYIVKINMIDDIAPSINGETSYKTDIKSILDTSIILNNLIVKDNIDISPSIQIEKENYTKNYYKVGIYQISFIAKDKNNNKSTPFIVNIICEDRDKPIFYISQKFIGVDANNELSIEEILDLINEANEIETQNVSSTTILENTYSPNYNIAGTYKVKIKYEYADSSEIILESNIVVSEYTEEKNKNTPKKTFWSVIKNLIIKVLNIIKRLFVFVKKLI